MSVFQTPEEVKNHIHKMEENCYHHQPLPTINNSPPMRGGDDFTRERKRNTSMPGKKE